MNPKLKRVWKVVAATAVAATIAPLVGVPAAHAAGTLAGAATVKSAGGAADLNSGNSATTFTLRLPAGAACPGDSANDGYKWSTYMVPVSVDPATLQFDSAGPMPGGLGASFRQPLWDTTGSPVVDMQTANADTPPGPGPILNIPDMNYAVFSPGDIPAGEYNLGVACLLGGPSATQMKTFWNTTKTFTSNAGGGPAQVNWAVGAKPAAPVLSSVSPGDGTLTATFSHTASNPATTQYSATATPTGGGAPVSATAATVTPITISGLTNGTEYSVVVKATNSVGDSVNSNAVTGTPNAAPRPAVQNLSATPGTGQVALNWDAPTGPAPTGYSVTVSPNEGTTTVNNADTSSNTTGLTAGTTYTFTVTPLHPSPYVGTASQVQATPLAAQVLIQDVSVVRPAGAIVLTQICGKHGSIPADTQGTPGFPNGSLPTVNPSVAGDHSGPTLTAGGSDTDPNYTAGEYPYPTDASGSPDPAYPTHCGINLGTAKFIRTGPGAGKFFATSGILNQVTVVDTRDDDTGWTVRGSMSTFSAGAGKSFSGSQLGWEPVLTSTTEAFTDSDGTSYDQVAAKGGIVQPNSPNATGLSSGATLGQAAGRAGTAPNFTGGLGIAELDSRLKLLIPVTAKSGTYTGTLTVTVIPG